MKIEQVIFAGMIAGGLLTALPAISSSLPSAGGVPVQMVVTARPAAGTTAPANLDPGELTVLEGKSRVPVLQVQRLTGAQADMQLFVLLDDSTRPSSLGTQLPELKSWVRSLPATTQVAAGYMRNGTVAIAQPFTPDHAKAAAALRLPEGLPGENGSPYFALSHLTRHWPSKQTTDRRVVLMLTDGVDRYYTSQIVEDPYVDAATRDALREGIPVYAIYLRGAGTYGRSLWQTTVAQSRLTETSDETGGFAYFQAFSDPVSIEPFLKDLDGRFANQYAVSIEARNEKGIQPVKLSTEVPGLKIEGPTRIYVP